MVFGPSIADLGAGDFTDTATHCHIGQKVEFVLRDIGIALLNIDCQTISRGAFLSIFLNKARSRLFHKRSRPVEIDFCIGGGERLNFNSIGERTGYNDKAVFQFTEVITVNQDFSVMRANSLISQLFKILKFFRFDQRAGIHCQKFFPGRRSVD